MRINNKRVRPTIRLIYSTAIIVLLLGVFFYFIPINTVNDRIPPVAFIALGGIVLFILRFLGHQQFEYDSDGEALNFKAQDSFLSTYSRTFLKSSDFPKKKLISYKIKGFPKRTLQLIITSKRSSTGVSKLNYNVTYLSSSEIKDLKRSLRRVVDENKTKAHVKMMEEDQINAETES